MKKTLYTTLAIVALAAIISMIGNSFNSNETMMNTTHYPMLVDTTANLITYDITNCRLDLACGQMPDTTQENVILCAAAAFTGKCLDTFEHTNILGQHISQATLYNGYTEDKDGIPFEQRYALFVWKGIDNQGNMLEKGFYQLPNDLLLEQVVEQSGMAFTQHWVIKDAQLFIPVIQPLERVEHFRSICQKDNRFFVIANKEPITYQQYLDALLAFGVENALYMDMGTGWNHSFYRDADNQLHILHPKTHSYPTNWLVVYK
jgi:hypothetical protein